MTGSQLPQTPPAQRHWRTLGLIITLFLLSLGTLWVLSLLQVIAASWATLLSAFFTIVGVLFALASWIWPRPSTTTRARPLMTCQGQGALQVLVRPELCGSTIYIDFGFYDIPPHSGRAMNIVERHNGNTVDFIAEDLALDPGNYTVSINASEPKAHVTIIPGLSKLIDWRRIHA